MMTLIQISKFRISKITMRCYLQQKLNEDYTKILMLLLRVKKDVVVGQKTMSAAYAAKLVSIRIITTLLTTIHLKI